MENTSNKYQVLLYPKAYRDIDEIYQYILSEILEPEIAKKQAERIWNAISSLSLFPHSHQDRLVGRYANGTYKQLLVDNYIIIYKISDKDNKVYVITVQYAKRNL